MNNHLALDIVLLPPKFIGQLAIDANRTLDSTAAAHYQLDHQACLPHITLLMGVVERKNLEPLQKIFEEVAQAMLPLPLEITGYYVTTLPDGKPVSSLVIKKEGTLQRLHETVLKKLTPFLIEDEVTQKMFYPEPPVNEFAVSWVKNFLQSSTREHYQPHITLGIGEVNKLPYHFPIKFTASQLAICHLGNYCTCREVLWSS